jgi:DNA-binding MarR family transcriptional regulator
MVDFLVRIDMTEHTEQTAHHTVVETDHFAEEAPLTYLFGDNARAKIIGAFVSERGHDVSVSEVARLAGVARSTVYNHLDTLEQLGIIKHTRDIEGGHSSLYQFNEDSQIGELIYKLEGVTLQKLIDEEYLE